MTLSNTLAYYTIEWKTELKKLIVWVNFSRGMPQKYFLKALHFDAQSHNIFCHNLQLSVIR